MSDCVEPSRDIARSGPRATLSETAFTLRATRGRNLPARDHVVLGGGFHGPRLSRSTNRTKRAWSVVDEHEKMKVAHYRDLSGGNEVNIMSPYKWCRFYINDTYGFIN